ncbi:hypothetical protein [Devosia sp.]|jgi:hypothetical protein|uniref:hypothetical protein n=1 Tax=Devosia sp. TaxID=1871048 RepID=UPI0037BEC90D
MNDADVRSCFAIAIILVGEAILCLQRSSTLPLPAQSPLQQQKNGLKARDQTRRD